MTAAECLAHISKTITGNDWSDWKTRHIDDQRLMAQREIKRYLFTAEYDDLIRVYDYPTYDDEFFIALKNNEWLINDERKLCDIRQMLAESESAHQPSET